jgi:HEAT repeat protein
VRDLGAAAVPALVATLDHADPYARWDAVNLLGELADDSAREAVVEFALREEEVHARWRAAWAVCRFDRERTVPALLSGLQAADAGRRWRAAMILSMMRREEALPVAIDGVESDDVTRQWEAVSALKALGRAGSERVLASLIDERTEQHVRQEAVLALGAVGTDEALDTLRGAVDEPDADVRWRLSLALARFGRRGVPVLRGMLERERDPRVRSRILEDLNRIEGVDGGQVEAL